MLNSKKAQVGETVTWIIATIVLIVILLVFIFASSTLAKFKSFKVNLKANSEEDASWIDSKTQIAYSLNNANRNKIVAWISQEEDLG